MKNGQKPSLVCIFLKHGKFWSVSQGYFIKHKLLISEYQLNYFSIVSPLYHVRSLLKATFKCKWNVLWSYQEIYDTYNEQNEYICKIVMNIFIIIQK